MQLHAVALAALGAFVTPWASSLTHSFKKSFFLTVCPCVDACVTAIAGKKIQPYRTHAANSALLVRTQEAVPMGFYPASLFSRIDTHLLMATCTYMYFDTFVLGGSTFSRVSEFGIVCVLMH